MVDEGFYDFEDCLYNLLCITRLRPSPRLEKHRRYIDRNRSERGRFPQITLLILIIDKEEEEEEEEEKGSSSEKRARRIDFVLVRNT